MITRWIVLLLLAAMGEKSTHAAPRERRDPSPVTLARQRVGGVPVHVVTVRLDSSRVRIAPLLAHGKVGASETLASMSRRTDPAAALTGTFFDTRTLLPVGDIVIQGRLVHFGGRGAALCLRRSDGALRARVRDGAGKDRHTDWGRNETVLAGGMWLVRHGELALQPKRQGFHDPGLRRPTQRVAVALLDSHTLLLVATSAAVTLPEWAAALQALGARDALNYDGGSSAGLYYEGAPLVKPLRRLTNALAVFVDPPRPSGRSRQQVARI